MVVIFRARGISRSMCKLVRTPMFIKKKKKSLAVDKLTALAFRLSLPYLLSPWCTKAEKEEGAQQALALKQSKGVLVHF